MVWNGPVKAGEKGSDCPVRAKQRPQASPAPSPGADPKDNWFMAAVKPLPVLPQAIKEIVNSQIPLKEFCIAYTWATATRVVGERGSARRVLNIATSRSFFKSGGVDSKQTTENEER